MVLPIVRSYAIRPPSTWASTASGSIGTSTCSALPPSSGRLLRRLPGAISLLRWVLSLPIYDKAVARPLVLRAIPAPWSRQHRSVQPGRANGDTAERRTRRSASGRTACLSPARHWGVPGPEVTVACLPAAWRFEHRWSILDSLRGRHGRARACLSRDNARRWAVVAGERGSAGASAASRGGTCRAGWGAVAHLLRPALPVRSLDRTSLGALTPLSAPPPRPSAPAFTTGQGARAAPLFGRRRVTERRAA